MAKQAIPHVLEESDNFVVQFERDSMSYALRHRQTNDLVQMLSNTNNFQRELELVERAYQMGLEHAEKDDEKCPECDAAQAAGLPWCPECDGWYLNDDGVREEKEIPF